MIPMAPGFYMPHAEESACEADPYFDDVLLLLHGNGGNGSTTITDSSSYARTMVANGTAAISTEQYKFNGSSIKVPNGASNKISLSGSTADFALAGDFCWEMWVYWDGWTTATDADARFISFGNSGDGWGARYSTNINPAAHTIGFVEEGVAWYHEEQVGWNPLQPAQWVHMVFQRRSNRVEIFENGRCISTVAWAETWGIGAGNVLELLYSWRGTAVYMDEVRLSARARYATTEGALQEGVIYFTPPTLPFCDA